MVKKENKPLTQADKELIFKQATSGLVHWHGNQFEKGMTDEELENALKNTLGIFGGSGGPGRRLRFFHWSRPPHLGRLAYCQSC